MMRWLMGVLLMTVSAYGVNMVNGVAFYVNDEPVTLYQLYKMARIANVSTQEAMEILIDQKIQEEEVAKYHLDVSEFEIDEEIQAIASQNAQSVEDMQRAIMSQGIDYAYYRDDIKKRILQKKLYSMVVSQNIELADESELKAYYYKHQSDFTMPTHVSIVRYGSASQQTLERMSRQTYPLGRIPPAPAGVISAPEEIETARLNPQLATLLMSIPAGKFTPVFNVGGEFVVFLVLSKKGGVLLPFEEAKRAIFGKIMLEREDKVIKEYFSKLRSVAKVKVVRLD